MSFPKRKAHGSAGEANCRDVGYYHEHIIPRLLKFVKRYYDMDEARRGTLTDGEVIASFRQAKNKKEQVGILADLQCCSRNDILDLLYSYGEDISMIKRCVRPGGGKPRRWSDEDIERLKLLSSEGISCEEIAIELGRSLDSVYAKAGEMGFDFAVGSVEEESPENKDESLWDESAARVWTEEDTKTMDRMYRRGESVRDIAAAIGCDVDDVKSHLKNRARPSKDSLCNSKHIGGSTFELYTGDDTSFDAALNIIERLRGMMSSDPSRLQMEFLSDDGQWRVVMFFGATRIEAIV